jgi:glucokinase
MSFIGQPKLIRKLNQSVVLKIIREQGPMSQADLVRVSGLSRGAIHHVVQQLLAGGWITKVGYGVSKGGRRPELLQFNPKVDFAIGVQLSARRVSVVLTDLDGEVLKELMADLPDPSRVLDILLDLTRQILTYAGENDLKVRGMGVAVPGSVQAETGIVNFAHVFDWQNFPLKEWMEKRLQIPVAVENDVNLAILGEMWRGAARERKNVVMVELSTGIGAGIVINGELYRGSSDAAGEIGHIVTNPECLKHDYSEWGCLESIIGKASLGGMIGPQREWGASESSFEEVFYQTLHQRSELSESIIGKICDHLSMALGNIIAVLNPELIVLGGYIAQEPEWFIAPIMERLGGLVQLPCAIVSPGLGRKSAILGAVSAVIGQTMGDIRIKSDSPVSMGSSQI